VTQLQNQGDLPITDPRGPSLRRIAVAVAAAVMILGVALAPLPAVALDADFVAANGVQEGIYPQLSIHPQSVYRDGVLFLAYQGSDFDPYIVSRDAASGRWKGPIRIGYNPLKVVSDGHGAPALSIDDAGYVHAFFGAHNSTLQHAVSTKPMDISTWRMVPMPAGRYTYPQIVPMTTIFCNPACRPISMSWMPMMALS